jgi:hypothetical protein
LILMGVGCEAVGLGYMIGCGVCVVCDGCGHAGGRWVGDLGFCFGRGVSLGGFGWRHGWMLLVACSGQRAEVIACSC